MIIVVLGASLVMLLWAVCYPLIVLSTPYAPLMQTAFLRALIGGVFLLFIALILKRPFPKSLRAWTVIAAVGITATSIGFWGMFYAGSLISPGLATVLTNTQPLIASVLAVIILKEEVTRFILIGIVLGFLGILVVGLSGVFESNAQTVKGTIYVLIASFGIAFSNILLKSQARKIDIFYAMGGQLVIGAIPLFALGGALRPLSVFTIDLYYLTILLALAIPGTALPFLLWYWLMDKAPLNQLNIFSFLTPIFGLYIGWIYFSESLVLLQWLGVVFVCAAVAVSVLSAAEKNRTYP